MAWRAWSCCRAVGSVYLTTTMHDSMPHDAFRSSHFLTGGSTCWCHGAGRRSAQSGWKLGRIIRAPAPSRLRFQNLARWCILHVGMGSHTMQCRVFRVCAETSELNPMLEYDHSKGESRTTRKYRIILPRIRSLWTLHLSLSLSDSRKAKGSFGRVTQQEWNKPFACALQRPLSLRRQVPRHRKKQEGDGWLTHSNCTSSCCK
jgi:hypothetical protein